MGALEVFMRTNAFRIACDLIMLTGVALLPLACASKPEPGDIAAMGAVFHENALVRFVNATTFKESVDLYRGEIKALNEVGRDKVTDYNEWLADRHDIELRTTGNSKPIATNSERLSAGERYTVVGYEKTNGTSGVAVFRDNAFKTESGKSRIRLIHVADGADELDVFPTGSDDSILEGVSYKTDSSAEIDPDVRSLDIRKDGEEMVSLQVPDLTLEAGKTYTIVVTAEGEDTLRVIHADNSSPIREGYLRR
jgi:hypothetical protein